MGKGIWAEEIAMQRACGSNELSMFEKQPGGQHGWKRTRVRVQEDPACSSRYGSLFPPAAMPGHCGCNYGSLKSSRRSRNAGVQVFHFTNGEKMRLQRGRVASSSRIRLPGSEGENGPCAPALCCSRWRDETGAEDTEVPTVR